MTNDASASPVSAPVPAVVPGSGPPADAVDASSRQGSRLRALLPDPAPWRASADFRRLWLAGLISNFGTFLSFVAVPVQLKELTGSAAAVARRSGRAVCCAWRRWPCWACACRA